MLVPAFIDQKLEEEIMENGYIILPNFLPRNEIDYLLGLHDTYHKEREIGCWNSLYDQSIEDGRAMSDKVIDVLSPHLAKYFKDWKLPVINWIVKNPGTHESFVHRDDSMHDEEKFQYRQCWMPLVNTTQHNGALYVVPKSHKFLTEPRPMGSKWAYEHLRNRLMKEIVPLYVNAGDMILYLERTLHGSPQNSSSEPRPVVQGGLMHIDSTPIFSKYLKETGEVVSYDTDVDFFLNKCYLNSVVDDKYPFLKKEKFSPKQVTEADVDLFFASIH